MSEDHDFSKSASLDEGEPFDGGALEAALFSWFLMMSPDGIAPVFMSPKTERTTTTNKEMMRVAFFICSSFPCIPIRYTFAYSISYKNSITTIYACMFSRSEDTFAFFHAFHTIPVFLRIEAAHMHDV